MSRRRPTAADIARKERELRGRGFDIYCGPSHIDRCIASHSHGRNSRHFVRPGHALDVGFDPPSGAPVSRYEKAHLDALTRELRADRVIDWGWIYNRGRGDHEDHGHADDVANYPGRSRLSGVTGITLDPRAFPSTGGRVPSGGRVRRGDRGKAVTAWQQDLVAAGHRVDVDGVFGPATETATRAFQRAAGVGVDGVVGPDTRAAMTRTRGTAGDTLRVGDRGTAVRTLQRGLVSAFPAYADPITATGGADGVFGPGTEQVVREFQRRSDLTADGIVGPATRAALAGHGIRP